MLRTFTNNHYLSAEVARLRLQALDPGVSVANYVGLPKLDEAANPTGEIWMHFEINSSLDYMTIDDIIQQPISANDLWSEIRARRNMLLAACDWTQIPDAALTLEEKQAWADYRQTLRNIPQDFATPDEVIFPEKPS